MERVLYDIINRVNLTLQEKKTCEQENMGIDFPLNFCRSVMSVTGIAHITKNELPVFLTDLASKLSTWSLFEHGKGSIKESESQNCKKIGETEK